MTLVRSILAAVVAFTLAVGVHAQVGKGVADLNSMSETELATVPGITPAIAKAMVAKRPFASITDANAFLLSQGLTQDQVNAVYAKAFVHLNLNTATREEILLVPGAGTRMTREFPEYRPWKTWAQFDREIGKYVGQEATDRLKQYVFIPLDVNTAADADLMTIPGMTAARVAQIKQGRPWTKASFEQKIGAPEATRLWRYFVVQ